MLRVLFEKRAEALPIATNQITEIADLWLRCSRDNWPLRAESGHILIDAAHYIIEEIRLQNWQVDSNLCTSVFSRFLIAATVFPDKVSELALALVERRDNSPFASDKEVLSEESQEVPDEDGFANIFDPRGPLADPWPDGPLRNVNQCVHNGFLSDTDPLQHLFTVRPDVGKEVLLALLIREPLQQFRESFGGVRNEFLHVATKRDWCPPMYFRGPFMSFLLANREKGVETIVALLNFVTDR
jgi:hypothetical protein